MNHKPLPSNIELGSTLARRVSQFRQHRELSIPELAERTRFSVQRLHDIESGLETWLSPTDRQRLAKALAIEPALFKEVEARSATSTASESHMLDRESIANLTQAILEGERDLPCPDCGLPLKCSVQEGLDMEENPIYIPRAFCLKCPFVLRA